MSSKNGTEDQIDAQALDDKSGGDTPDARSGG